MNNLFKDPGYFQNDKTSFDNKVIYTRVTRRPPAQKVNVQCENCKQVYNISPTLTKGKTFYYCDQCILEKVQQIKLPKSFFKKIINFIIRKFS